MSAASLFPMARPKKILSEPGPKPTALTIKGSRLWRAWVDGLAKHRRTDVAKVVDAALTEYAEKYGYEEKPPER